MKKSTLFFFLVITGLLGVNTSLLVKKNTETGVKPIAGFFDCKDLLSQANTLSSKKVYSAAASAYESYIDSCAKNKKDAAMTYLRVGELFYNAQDYSKSLAAYYKAEGLDESVKKHSNEKVVSILERMDLTQEARFEQDKRVSLEPEKITRKGKAIARIGKNYVYQEDIESLLKEMPAELKKMSETPQVKAMLIKQYVDQEALYIKAKRLGLDKDELLKKTLELNNKQLMIKYLLEKELADKMQISEEELKDYYERKKEEYKQSASLALIYKELKTNVEKTKTELEKSKQEPIWIDETFTYIPELGTAEDIVVSLFEMKQGEIKGPVEIDGKKYLLKVVEKTEAGHISYEELKQKLYPVYKQEKQKKVMDDYIAEVIESEDVELYPVSETQEKEELKKSDPEIKA